jgi:putative glutamine amidotransferase
MAPVIGITTYDDQASWRDWSARAAVLPWTYVDAVRRGGGRPVLLPPGGDAAEAAATVAGLDGVVVAGGPDIGPASYGARPHPRTRPAVPGRDAWELAVTASALRLGVPVLAICRGMQVLNVLRGGTLHQHLPDLVGHGEHGGIPGGYGQHKVRVDPGSMLAGILAEDGYFQVPTRHHQAVDRLGDGLVASAWAEDGTVEAVEAAPQAGPQAAPQGSPQAAPQGSPQAAPQGSPQAAPQAGPQHPEDGHRFVLGVQWHPEQGDDPRLFAALAAAAAERARGGAGTVPAHGRLASMV